VVAQHGISRVWGFFLLPALTSLNALNASFLLYPWWAIFLYVVGTGFGITLAVGGLEDLPAVGFVWIALAAMAHLFAIAAAYLFRKEEIRRELGEQPSGRMARLLAHELNARAFEKYWPWLARRIRASSSPIR
jgi:hypothetical protein